MAAKVIQCDGCLKELVIQTKFDLQAINEARTKGWLCSGTRQSPRSDFCPNCRESQWLT